MPVPDLRVLNTYPFADADRARIERYLAGERLWNVVDPARGY